MADTLWTNRTTDGTSTEVEVTGPCTVVISGNMGGCQQVIECRYDSNDFIAAGAGATIQELTGYTVNWVGTFDIRLRQINSGANTSVSAVVQGS
jgi:hypothetical protein